MNAPDLHCHSGYSIYDGFGSPKSVVDRAVELGWGAACLTEHGHIMSAPALYQAAREAKIKPILGCEMYVTPDEDLIDGDKAVLKERRHLTVLALSFEGYQNLVAWQNESMQRPAYYSGPRLSIDRMVEIAPHGLHHNAVLSGCLAGELCQCLLHENGNAETTAKLYLQSAKLAFPNFYLELMNHKLDKFMGVGFETYEMVVRQQEQVRDELLKLSRELDIPVIVTNDSHFQSSQQRKPHVAMMARKQAHGTSESFAMQYGYWCVGPEVRVLTHDLRWVEAGSLRKGDKLWGFDEGFNGNKGDHPRIRNRRFRKTVVLNAGRRTMATWEVQLSNGDSLLVSHNHPWLVWQRSKRKQLEWRSTEELSVGDVIPRYMDVWDEADDWGSGWLAGIFDGEGSTAVTRYVKMAQNEGVVLEQTRTLLNERQFGYTERAKASSCQEISINGSLANRMHFVGAMRPVRLLEKYVRNMEGAALIAFDEVIVTKMKFKGMREVVTLGTSTKTFFAEGYGAHNTSYMRSMESIAASLPVWAEREAIDSIEGIVAEADIHIDPLDTFSYTLPRSGYDDPIAEIRRRSKARLKNMVQRYGDLASERFEYELAAMGGFAHYLLIYSDIIRMCRDSGIYTWTRGSAANSLVNYCLKIHEIDPIRYKLIFERFVNPARAKFPDVDIDIEGHRQADVVRMITEHMEPIEGKGNMLGICTYGTLNNRASFRMMAEAAGVDPDKIDELAKLLPQMIDSGMVQSDEEAYEVLSEELGIDLHANAAAIFDQLGSVGQHACAFALGTEDRPLSEWVPQYRIGSSDTLVTQYNMKYIEELGFLKLDLLKLDSLSIIHSIARMLGEDITWVDKVAMPEPGIYELDDETLKMLREGRTEGIHSFQGGSQRRGAIEVGVESVDDMVAVQALYRPSGTRTGNDKHYVDRKHGREDWSSTNEFVGKFLDESYGFAIYQEQIMEMAFAMGMSGEEVDDLYKAIKTAKGAGRGAKELFESFEPTFRKYASKLWSKADADEVWAQWDHLQGYTFNRGHASSYAIIAAKMAWLKCHHPHEFFIALLERYPGNPRYVAAAIAEGFHFEPPDVNASGRGFSKGSTDKSIRVGLVRINGIGDGAANAIVRNQPFASVEDLVERVGSRFIKQGEKVNTLEILGAVGALESLGIGADDDDLTQYRLLGFVLRKPLAFKGIKPSLPARRGGKWEFLGLSKDAVPTWGKKFCAKLFWIPPDAEFVTKTSATGKYNAHLLTVIDSNGLPFDLIVSEDKTHEAKLVKYLHRKCQGTVICAEGQIAMPFLRGGNTGFRLWGISGAEDANPQCWGIEKQDAKAITVMAQDKRAARSV